MNLEVEIMVSEKYPSRIKYEENNPAITCRVPKELKEKIEKMKKMTGKSISQIIVEILTNAEIDFSKVVEKVKEENAIWFYCKKCKKKVYIIPNSKCHNEMIRYMEEHGWCHGECLDN